ncbi:MAG: methyltransferase [Actinomycetota bacterium]
MNEQPETAPAEEANQYFAPSPTTASDRTMAELRLPDVSVDLVTDRGVFARGRIDTGTKLLLLDGPASTPDDRHLLDLGAGYGPIAVTLAIRNPDATVWAVEINDRARDLCRDNAAAAGVTNLQVIDPDGLPDDVSLDRVWSNPPVRIGKPAMRSLLARWLDRLGPDGSAHLVVQKHLGSDSLQKWFEQTGWSATRRRSRAGYRLLDVERPR